MSNHQMIPDAAVEAALVGYDPSWAPIPGFYGPQEHFRRKMLAALEAAAPHIAAAALEEAADDADGLGIERIRPASLRGRAAGLRPAK